MAIPFPQFDTRPKGFAAVADGLAGEINDLDFFAAAAAEEIEGNLSVTLDALTVSSAAEVDVKGAASVTLGALTAQAAGAVAVTAQASITLGALTASAVAEVPLPEVPPSQEGVTKPPPRRSRPRTVTKGIRPRLDFLPIECRASITLDDLRAASTAAVTTPIQSRIVLDGLSASAKVHVRTHARTFARLDGLVATGSVRASWDDCIRDDDEFLLIHAA